MENKESDKTFKDLFLYHIYNPVEYKYEMNYKIIDLKNNDNDLSIIEDKLIYNNIDNNETEEFDILLAPYFNTIYEEGKHYTKIYNDYFLNNIYRMEGFEDGRYRYNLPNIDIVYKDPIIKPEETEEVIQEDNGFIIKDLYLTHGEINNIQITDEEIINYIKSQNGLLYYYNIINLYNHIINNNLDPNYDSNTNELSSHMNLSKIKYYSNNPKHYFLLM